MSERVTVVTPSYNLGRYLPSTIESVLKNLRDGDEYWVIDGGSTDGSVEIIRRHERRLAGWVSEPDLGFADALGKGFERATGAILCWINAGDVLLPGALEAAREALARTGADMIFGDDFYIDEDSRVISFSRGYVRDLRAAMLFGGWTPLQDACFWRRSLYEQIGGLNVGLKYAADYDLFLRMALASRAVYVPLAFSAFRRHPGQKSIAGAPQYRIERRQVRAKEIARARGPLLGTWLNRVWQPVAVRWRVHVSQRRWARPDLAGRKISDLPCRTYWPASG